jgi:single-strand DNA-binding protein
MNNVTIAGKVGQQPELRYTQGGMPLCTFGVGTTSGKDEKKKTIWHNIVVFGPLAEHCSASIQKGSTVIICGRIDVEDYETKTGEKRKANKIIADEVGISLRWAPAFSEDKSKFENAVGMLTSAFPSPEDPF